MGMWNTVNRKCMSVVETWGLDSEVDEQTVAKFYMPSCRFPPQGPKNRVCCRWELKGERR